jgi:hypothetical protein
MGLFDFLRGGAAKARFAEEVMTRLRQRGWPHPIRFDRDRFALDFGEGGVMNLAVAFATAAELPASGRHAPIEALVEIAFDTLRDPTWEEAAPLLLPVLRTRTWLAASSDGDQAIPFEPLVGPLAVVAAIDRPASIEFVTAERLRDWGVDATAAMAQARENMAARTEARFKPQRGGFFVSCYEDGFDCARILSPSLFESLGVRGAPVAVVGGRDWIAVAGADDEAALAAMSGFVEEAIGADLRPLSCAPLVLDEGRWRLADNGADAPAPLRRLATLDRVVQHRWQKILLEEEPNAFEGDLADLEAFDNDAALRTWTLWSEGAAGLLGRADAVLLEATDGQIIARAWEDVEAACGPFRVRDDLYPPRYQPARWPDPAAWAALSAARRPTWTPEAMRILRRPGHAPVLSAFG